MKRGLLGLVGTTAIMAVFLSGLLLVLRDNRPGANGGLAEPHIVAATSAGGVDGAPDQPASASRAVRRTPASSAESGAHGPVAPDGYAFAWHHAEMAAGGTVTPRARDVAAGPDWLRSPDALSLLAAQAAASGRGWTFGYAALAPGVTLDAFEQSITAVGGRVVESSGRLVRVRLPGNRTALEAITALDGVTGLGAAPREVKLAGFGGRPDDQPNRIVRVFVTLMEGDPDGTWRRRLETLGAAVGDYDADLRSYTAFASTDAVQAMAGADFVAAVEPVGTVRAINDTAVPAMGADALYVRDGSSGVFSGQAGASVPVGVMDTGLNLNHPDIRKNRESICGAYFPLADDGEDLRVETDDLWIDAGLHGTHVTGTILGNGSDEPRFAGMAPGVKHVRFAKVLHREGYGSGEAIRRGMDWMALASDCGGAAARPLVVNMSLSGSSRYWEGRSVGERKVDSTVWMHGQLYVVAQGNANEYSFSNYGAAKNTLAVGAVHDIGGHATFTSLGPTRDGRLAPQVVATGVHVHSARGGGSPGGYERFNGTSMAAPSVAGVAALLMDAVPVHKGNPALTRATLMASAIRPDAWMEDPGAFALDNSNGPGPLQNIYGLGKASARTAVLDRNTMDGWRSGSAVAEPVDGEYAYVDIDVPVGASRLDLVMTWDEPPADTLSNAVLNDLDVWLDRDGDCAGAECGEYASTSRIDNVEWIFVRDPPPGTYRAKVAAREVYTAPPRAALAWTVIRGPSTPELRVDADPVALGADTRLAADAWNASPAVALVDIGAGIAEAPAGANDDFDDAEKIEGAEGSAELDLWAATPESGEPELAASPFARRPVSSAWYAWTAPESRVFHFGVRRPTGELSEHARVGVFDGEHPPSLREIRSGLFNVSFRAEAHRTYRVRLASFERSENLELHWSTGRPANDDFGLAESLEGESGETTGTTVGATLENGESWGDHAATTWYRWTAPENGWYRFRVSARFEDRDDYVRVDYLPSVLVFVGAGLEYLRLVSPYSSNHYHFPARAGVEYRIAVATRGADEGGAPYQLRWSAGGDSARGNDAFTGAEDLPGTPAGRAEVLVNSTSTVEPDEPEETGVRTRWWAWEAPADGRYTWRLEPERASRAWRQLRIRAFAGSSLEDLVLVGTALASNEFSVALGGGEMLHLATGFPASGPDAFSTYSAYGELTWGPTPANDVIAGAGVLDMEYGAVSGSNRFATTDEGVRLDVVGRSAVWWTFEAPADGWYRFSADGEGGPWALTVHDGTAGIAASSRWQQTGDDAAEVLFFATAGSRHAISLGVAAGGARGDFTLRWDSAEAPFWLRYTGRLADGYRDRNDQPVEIRMAGELAFGGDALYLASGLGLSAFERDPATGELTFAQLVDGAFEHASLAWDGDRSRLLAHDCGAWRSFEIGGDGPGVEAPSDLLVADDPARCGRLLVHREGTFVYRIGDSGIDTFAIEEGGGLRFADSHEGHYLTGAATSADGFLYGSSGAELIVLWTDAETGELSWAGTGDPLASPWWQDDPLVAAGGDGTLLFVDDGEAVHAFSLEDPLDPERLGTLPRAFPKHPRWGSDVREPCVFASVRGDSAVDVLCGSWGYVAEWRSGGETLVETERFQGGLPDRFNNLVPEFYNPVGTAASPDGRHVYVSTAAQGILIFERVAAPGDVHRLSRPEGVDLVVVSGSVDDSAPLAGDPFRFSSTVRNRGNTRSDASTLRIHRSLDATVSSSDSEVATRPIGGLEPSADADVSVSLTAPSSAGGYYYGVCVDSLESESNTDNNCGGVVEVRVRTPLPDLVVGAPVVDDAALATGEPFTLSTTVRNNGEGRSTGATTLRYYRSSDATVSSDDAEVGTDSVGSIDAGAEIDMSISLAAPLTAGTYYYGACADAVDSESDTTNNCSHGVEVEVFENDDGESGGSTDDHGNTTADATPVSIPSTTEGDLEVGGDSDYFRVEVARTITLTLETTGNADTYGTLRGSPSRPTTTTDLD